MTSPPGPTSSPLLQTLRWQLRPLAFLQDCRSQFGETFSVRFAGAEAPMVVVSHPDAVRAVYANPENGMPHGRNVMLKPLLGPRSILLLEGGDHLLRRKLMATPFHGEQMRSYGGAIEGIVGSEIDSWPIGREFALLPRMQAVTLEIILRVIFGFNAGPSLDRMRVAMERVLTRTALNSSAVQLVGIAVRKGFRGRQPLRRAIDATTAPIDRQIHVELAARRSGDAAGDRQDMLSALMSLRFEDGTPIGDAELRDQLMTLLLAGHETTATALAWSFELLLRHPEQLQKLRESLALGEEGYLRATVTEALRLRAVLPLVGRRLSAETTIDGHTLAAGTDVTVAIWLTHTRPDLYPDPFAFRPERFLREGPDTYAWLPFGGGVRRCLGAAFAEFEMRIVLREVLTRCQLVKAAQAPERVARRNITLSPRRGTRVIVSDRQASP